MTFISSHPNQHTRTERTWSEYRSYRHYQPLRRLASISTRLLIVDILRNRAKVTRESWDASFSVGTITIALIRK